MKEYVIFACPLHTLLEYLDKMFSNAIGGTLFHYFVCS